jgi:segregation and condensation protein A
VEYKMIVADYRVDLPAYAGPLDVLLHLIERQELDITVISLYQVTEQFLAHVQHLKEERIEQLADFLAIAARLLLIKSRALLPQVPTVPSGEEEEDPADALIKQLRRYKRFRQAGAWLGEREEKGLRTYLRVAPPPKLEGILDLSGITVETLMNALTATLARAGEREDSVSLARPRRITMDAQIRRLRRRLGGGDPIRFEELLAPRAGRLEVAITLLAVLELIKLRELEARQTALFGPIELMAIDAMNGAVNGEA